LASSTVKLNQVNTSECVKLVIVLIKYYAEQVYSPRNRHIASEATVSLGSRMDGRRE
jgi:hypothetical protein